MYDVRKARVAALYRSASSTDTRALPQTVSSEQASVKARAWQAELARSMARAERNLRPEIVSPTHPVSKTPLRPHPNLLIVGNR